MGAHQNNGNQTGNKQKGRGSVDNTGRLSAFTKAAGGGSADWGGCDPRRIQAVMVAITSLGGAVTFGLSRNMGAHFLTLLLDDGRETLWFNGKADLDEELDTVLATLEVLA